MAHCSAGLDFELSAGLFCILSGVYSGTAAFGPAHRWMLEISFLSRRTCCARRGIRRNTVHAAADAVERRDGQLLGCEQQKLPRAVFAAEDSIGKRRSVVGGGREITF
ncbi:hypothetical protein M8818_003946 [Zalaria obscura]|uniref:Uncharacterized protein n=1 Tax=Zalaria obscura TaxID=2024903 RepID=A0ACC3SE34_9PEZI